MATGASAMPPAAKASAQGTALVPQAAQKIPKSERRKTAAAAKAAAATDAAAAPTMRAQLEQLKLRTAAWVAAELRFERDERVKNRQLAAKQATKQLLLDELQKGGAAGLAVGCGRGA